LDDFEPPLGKNILKVNIYLDALRHTEISESPAIDLITLVSNIGGSVGLFTGICVITCFEIVELAIKVGLVFWHRRNKKTHANKKKNQVFDIENMPKTIGRDRNFQEITYL
jgi:hypothetical protein